MEHPGFFDRSGPFSISEIGAATGSTFPEAQASVRLSDVRPLSDAGPEHVSFIDNRKYLPQLAQTRAGACFVSPVFSSRLPGGTVPLVSKTPYRAFAQALHLFYPGAMWSKVGSESGSLVAASARIEDGAVIEAGAIVGPEATIGRGSRIAAGAVVGYRVAIGRNTFIGPNATVIHALIGDRVIIHPGVRIGQDGFGFAMSAGGHLKVPQIGRVIVQDDVEIGANTCVDRGALKDTIIGEGSKIDNLVQIGHNVIMGRHCVIVGQVGLSGSSELGDFVVMGGHSGAVGHVKIGAGAQIAGSSHVNADVPPGARMGGTPAVPFRDWARQMAVVRKLGEQHGNAKVDLPSDEE